MSEQMNTLKKVTKSTVKWGIKFPIVASVEILNTAVVNSVKTVKKVLQSPFDTYKNTKNQM